MESLESQVLSLIFEVLINTPIRWEPGISSLIVNLWTLPGVPRSHQIVTGERNISSLIVNLWSFSKNRHQFQRASSQAGWRGRGSAPVAPPRACRGPGTWTVSNPRVFINDWNEITDTAYRMKQSKQTSKQARQQPSRQASKRDMQTHTHTTNTWTCEIEWNNKARLDFILRSVHPARCSWQANTGHRD